MSKLKLAILLLIQLCTRLASAACASGYDYETMIAGYAGLHTVSSLVYAIDSETLDIAVGGLQETEDGIRQSFVYVVSEKSCRVK